MTGKEMLGTHPCLQCMLCPYTRYVLDLMHFHRFPLTTLIPFMAEKELCSAAWIALSTYK